MTSPSLHELHLRNQARRSLIATQATPARPLAYAPTSSSGMAGTFLVSPDPSKPGRWRATWLDGTGEPSGHTEAPDCAAAIVAAWHMGADLDTAREPPT